MSTTTYESSQSEISTIRREWKPYKFLLSPLSKILQWSKLLYALVMAATVTLTFLYVTHFSLFHRVFDYLFIYDCVLLFVLTASSTGLCSFLCLLGCRVSSTASRPSSRRTGTLHKFDLIFMFKFLFNFK